MGGLRRSLVVYEWSYIGLRVDLRSTADLQGRGSTDGNLLVYFAVVYEWF